MKERVRNNFWKNTEKRSGLRSKCDAVHEVFIPLDAEIEKVCDQIRIMAPEDPSEKDILDVGRIVLHENDSSSLLLWMVLQKPEEESFVCLFSHPIESDKAKEFLRIGKGKYPAYKTVLHEGFPYDGTCQVVLERAYFNGSRDIDIDIDIEMFRHGQEKYDIFIPYEIFP